jgi:hypothetical protein
MDVQSFVSEFLSSQHGQDATAALAAQGIDPDAAQQMLSVGAEAAHAHVESQNSGLLGEHAGKSFFAAFAAGIVKGDGVMSALGDGLEGIVGAKVTEALAERAGLDPGMASTVAAAATPYLVSFIKSKFD